MRADSPLEFSPEGTGIFRGFWKSFGIPRKRPLLPSIAGPGFVLLVQDSQALPPAAAPPPANRPAASLSGCIGRLGDLPVFPPLLHPKDNDHAELDGKLRHAFAEPIEVFRFSDWLRSCVTLHIGRKRLKVMASELVDPQVSSNAGEPTRYLAAGFVRHASPEHAAAVTRRGGQGVVFFPRSRGR
jgi:hypothetical protein